MYMIVREVKLIVIKFEIIFLFHLVNKPFFYLRNNNTILNGCFSLHSRNRHVVLDGLLKSIKESVFWNSVLSKVWNFFQFFRIFQLLFLWNIQQCIAIETEVNFRFVLNVVSASSCSVRNSNFYIFGHKYVTFILFSFLSLCLSWLNVLA